MRKVTRVRWFENATVFVVMIVLVLASCAPSQTAVAPQSAPEPQVAAEPEPQAAPEAAITPAQPEAPTAVVPPSSITTFSINTMSKSGFGDYLVDFKGMTLYYFTKDVIGKSNAAGAVLEAWPIFNTEKIAVPSGLNAEDFSIITRDDGLTQTAYKGWPLYYYVKDQVAGDMLGEGVGGVWFVMKEPFYTVMLQTKADLGNYLVDSKGMTLYYFTKDSPGKSTAAGAVLQAWPIFSPEDFTVVASLKGSDFGTITRDDGLLQAIYKGWPLYTYVKDQVSGDTNGQGVNGVWFVIDPGKFSPQLQSQPAQPAPIGPPDYGY